MKKAFLFISFFLGFIYSSFSQNMDSDSIKMEKRILPIYFQNGKHLKPFKMLKIMKNEKEAFDEMKKANINYYAGTVSSIPGLVCLGLVPVTISGRLEFINVLFITGLSCALLSITIPFYIAYSKHSKKAVHLYNQSFVKNNKKNINFKVALQPTGLGLQLNF